MSDKISKIAAKYLPTAFNILVKHCEVDRALWGNFYSTVNLAPECFSEYRFEGNLGSGGKLFYSVDGWHVDTYPELKTPTRIEAIQKCNEELARLHTRFLEEAMEISW